MTSEGKSTLPWSFRFAEATRAPLLLVGLGVALAYLCFFVLFHNATGGLDGLRIEDRPLWLHRYGATAFSYALLFGYLIIVVSHFLRFASARLRDLRPVLTLNSSEIEEFDAGLRRVKRWQLRLIGAVGVGLVTVMDMWLFGGVAPDSRPQPWVWWMAFFLAQDFVVAWMACRFALIGFVVAHRFSELGGRHAVIDLFDLQAIRPFTQLGLRLALLILISFAIMVPTMSVFFTVADVGLVVAYGGGMMLGIPLIVATVLLLLPLRGVHRAIVRAKVSALERVRAEVGQEHEAVLASDQERKTLATQRLPGLLAHEARLERVREWPLDFPSFLRFALYVLIPLGSWVAAAFVERALGAALE